MQTLSQQLSTAAPSLRVHRASTARTQPIRRSLIGEVNDPERSKKQIKDKESNAWGTPKNDNPVEKRTIGHDAFVPNAGGEGDEDVLDKVKEAGKDVVEGIKETVGGKKDE